jgi:hypothetical protein
MVGALQMKEMFSALREHLHKKTFVHSQILQEDSCNSKTKIAAFAIASDSEKLTMPPRSSFGRYLQ